MAVNARTEEFQHITISYSSGKISKITDGVGRVYTFTYTSGLLSKIAFMGTGSSELASESFTYSSGNLTGIRSTVSISADLAYTSNHLLNKVTDASGYRLQYTYNTTGASQPNRIIRVTEQDGSTTGGTLDIEYSHMFPAKRIRWSGLYILRSASLRTMLKASRMP